MQDLSLYRTFVSCMAAYIRGETVSPEWNDDEWKMLYALARRQSLSGALFASLKKSAMPAAMFAKLQRDAFLTLTAYEAQEAVIRRLRDTFIAAAIPFALFKGAIIRAFYRDPTMRSMGDIDAVIHPADRDRAHEALTAAGFVYESCTPEVWVYTCETVHVELHTVLRRYHADEQEIVEYDTLWEDIVLTDTVEMRLTEVAEVSYVIAHLAMHFADGGCGLRQLMDVAVCYAHAPDEALWGQVLAHLAPLGLDSFARRLLWLCREWLGVDTVPSLCTAVDEESEAFLHARLLGEGTFGTDERMMLAKMRRDKRRQSRGGATGTLWRWVFPPMSELRRRYAYAANPLLLPVAYGHRLFEGVTKHRRTHQKRLAYAKEQADTLAYEVAMFEKIGL